MRECNKITENDPKIAVSWNLKGNALSHKGEHNEAIAAYDRAIELAPQWEAPRRNKSVALQELYLCKRVQIEMWHNPRQNTLREECDLEDTQPSGFITARG
jgi:tetratricopeptide (TPR) repeat protein